MIPKYIEDQEVTWKNTLCKIKSVYPINFCNSWLYTIEILEGDEMGFKYNVSEKLIKPRLPKEDIDEIEKAVEEYWNEYKKQKRGDY